MFVQSDALLLQIHILLLSLLQILNMVSTKAKHPFPSCMQHKTCLVPEMLPGMQLIGIAPPKQN